MEPGTLRIHRTLESLVVLGLGHRLWLRLRILRNTGTSRLSGAIGNTDRLVGSNISNKPSFRLKHLGVLDGSDGSDGTLYPLTENYTLPVAQATGRVA